MVKISVEQTKYGIKIFSGDNTIEVEDFSDIHNLLNDLQENYNEKKLKYIDNFLFFTESVIDDLTTVMFSSYMEVYNNKNIAEKLLNQLNNFDLPDKLKHKVKKRILRETLIELIQMYQDEMDKFE